MIKLIKGNKNTGFSLIETIVGLGLMSAVGVGVMSLQSNQVKSQKSIDVDYEVKILSSVIYDQLKTKGACEATFNGRSFAAPFNFTNIRDASGNILFSAPQNYKGQNNIGISRFMAEPQSFAVSDDPQFREGSVRVAFEYRKTSGVLNNQTTYKKYIHLPIRVRISSTTGVFESCTTASDDAISTSMNKFCESLNGVYDVVTEQCNLNANFPNTNITDVNTSSAHQAVSSSNFGLGMWQNIFANRYVDKNTNSNITGLVSSQSNVVLNSLPVTSMDAINKSYLDSRIRCPVGQVGFMTGDGVKCDTLVCNNPLEYLVGVNPNGEKLCLPLVSTEEKCPNGGSLSVKADGSVGFQCCSPICDGAGARCTGENFPSSNGCGLCQGTAPTVIEGNWTPWVDTGDTRETSECIANQIQMEKKQTRSCVMNTTLLSCQELNCSGSDEQWTVAPPISCGSQGLHYFFTASLYTANLGGKAGADAKCNSDANALSGKTYESNLGDHCTGWTTPSWGTGFGTSGCLFPRTGPWYNDKHGTESFEHNVNNYYIGNSGYGSGPTFWQAYHFYALTGPATNCNNWSSTSCPAGAPGGQNACAIRGDVSGVCKVGNTNCSGFLQACSEYHSILCLEKATSCTPINGGWSDWTEHLWDSTGCTSGKSKYRKVRYCNNPMASCGGNRCVGQDDYGQSYEITECK